MRRPGTGPILAGVGIATALLFFAGMAAGLPSLRMATKPFPALALAAWVALGCRRPLGRLTAVGLLLSALGDTLLEAGRFLPGLLAFLAAHLTYVAAFLAADRRSRAPSRSWPGDSVPSPSFALVSARGPSRWVSTPPSCAP